MSWYLLLVVICAVVSLGGAVYYVHCALGGKAKPVIATWILMMVMMGLSVWTYAHSPSKSLTANIGIIAGAVNVFMILTGVVWMNIRRGVSLRATFDLIQILCLLGGVGVFVFWVVTESHLISYIAIQAIALLAYAATVNKLRKAHTITEPLLFWIAMLVAGLSAIYPAVVRQDVFAAIYLIRAVPSTGIVIYLIWKIQRRMRL